MSKLAIEIYTELKLLEALKEFDSRQELYQACATNLKIKIDIVKVYVGRYGFKLKTPKKRPRRRDVRADAEFDEYSRKLRQNFNESSRVRRLVTKAENDDKRAGIALFCYECQGREWQEIYKCKCSDCPLWRFRPKPPN